ncbi:MAG: DUF1214 domain-containing protein [Ignavibacteria bacterium]|nr:DUF1214 domain-containing protein [Bacteroidia bacterium]MBT8379792.1 DUF1214 domain-containing protein [Ignavibacteria bacterium]MBT8382774.1 DUF1214 domain-containing protein [Ignavibacteria bacterium]NNJ53128.1 DUF1254 domain-containing protein [Ignavibacteriaceae bacterium]
MKKFKALLVFLFSVLLISGMQAQTNFKGLTIPEVWEGEVKTLYGTMEFDHGMPTKSSVEDLYANLDAFRASELYLWSLPIVSNAQWRKEMYDKHPNFKNRSVLHIKTYNDRIGVLTINQSSEYFASFINTDDDATIIKVPAGIVVGLITDMWQRGLTDLGLFGINAGGGGTFILYGPRTPKDKIPDIKGAQRIKSETSNAFLLMRFIQFENQPTVEEVQSKVHVYAASENPSIDLVPGDDKPLQNFAPRGMAYWELLHEILQEEDVDDRDRFFMYWAHTLGIERGKPFNPSESQKLALSKGVVSGEAVGKAFVFTERLEGVLRKDGWRYIISGKLPDAFENTQRVRDFDMLDPRSRFTYEACTSSPRMGNPEVGKGQAYAGKFEDNNGKRLKGGESYILKFNQEPPVKIFWSIVFYDVETRSLILNDSKNATIGSRATPDLKMNDDGSFWVFVGPEPPKGWESNWIETVPGRGWFPYVRLYGPGEEWFDEDAFTLPEIENVNFADYE